MRHGQVTVPSRQHVRQHKNGPLANAGSASAEAGQSPVSNHRGRSPPPYGLRKLWDGSLRSAGRDLTAVPQLVSGAHHQMTSVATGNRSEDATSAVHAYVDAEVDAASVGNCIRPAGM